MSSLTSLFGGAEEIGYLPTLKIAEK